MQTTRLIGGAALNVGAFINVRRGIGQVKAAIEGGRLHRAVVAGCEAIVAEVVRRDRPLAWHDVTGNLRASIAYQVERHVGPNPIASRDGSRQTYNAGEYRSGRDTTQGVYGIVFAPPDYALHLEMKATRSVLIAPLAMTRDRLLGVMGEAAARDWNRLGMNGRVVA